LTLGRETELAILYEISTLPMRLSDSAAILHVALDKITRLFGAEVAIVYLQRDGALTATVAQGLRLNKVLPTVPLPADPATLGRHTQTWAAGEQGPLAVDPLQGRYPAQAAAGIPIWDGADLLGWIYAARFKPQPFTPSEVSLFNILAEHIASALAMTQSRARDQQHQAVLEAANQRLAAMLAEMTQAQQQTDALRHTIDALATPVLRIADDVLLLPLVGSIDHHRLTQITGRLLAVITRYRARVCIIDITGVASIDTFVAGSLVQLASAARLLGATVILCGIVPEVAQIVVSLGLSLEVMIPTHDVQSALLLAFQQVHLRIVKI
jgi:rsbT co-antagonist protein RsbR